MIRLQRLRQEEEERKAAEREANMTPEEKLAEKLRLQKIQEEADLRAAMDTFGVTDKTGIDALQPKTKTELSELADAISKKVSQYKHLVDFPGFLEELVRNVCANCEYLNGFIALLLLKPLSFINSLHFFSVLLLQWARVICRKSRKPSTICTQKSKNWKKKRAKKEVKANQK